MSTTYKAQIYINTNLLFFITPILKSLVVPIIWLALTDVIYSQIAPFFALNRIFFPANEEATLKTKQPVRFQGLFNRSNCWSNCRKNERQRVSCGKFCNFCFQNSYFFPPRDGWIFRPAQYCINKMFELTKSCIWAISKWM